MREVLEMLQWLSSFRQRISILDLEISDISLLSGDLDL